MPGGTKGTDPGARIMSYKQFEAKRKLSALNITNEFVAQPLQRKAHLGGIDLSRLVVFDFMGLGCEHTPSFNDFHAQTRQRGFQVALDFIGQILGVRGNPRAIIGHIPLDRNTKGRQVIGIAHFPDPSGRRQERFGGDAAAIDARAADVAAGKDGGAQFLGPGVEGRAVATDAAANNGDVKVVIAAFAGGEGSRAESSREGSGGDKGRCRGDECRDDQRME
jgi:hypothetical protein